MKMPIPHKTAAWALACLVLLNALMYGLHWAGLLVPVDKIEKRIAEAFEKENFILEQHTRQLGLSSNRTMIGIDQFTDGLIIEMALYRHPSIWRSLFVPKIAVPDVQDTLLLKNETPMLNLKLFATGAVRVSEDHSYYYHRYWWGQKAILSLLLTVFDFFQINNGLKLLTVFGFACFGFLVAFYERSRFWPLFPYFAFGILFSAVPYYGGIVDSTTFLTSVVLLILLYVFQRRRRSLHTLALFFTASGCAAAFVYSMRGGLMLFLASAFWMLYFFTFEREKVWERYRNIGLCIAFFFVGFFGSFAIRQVVAAMFLDVRSVFGAFLFQLKMRVGAGTQAFDTSPIHLIQRQFFNYVLATLNSRGLCDVIIASSLAAWLAALIRAGWIALKRKDFSVLLDAAALAAASAIVFARVFILRNHSYLHAYFISRYLFIPFSLGWTALILAFRRKRA